MNKAAKKITGALLAGALGAASLTGCSSPMDGNQPLLTSGEDTVTVGTGNLMLRMNQATMLSYYSMMGGSTTGLWSQDSGDGETYGDTTKASVLDELENMLVQKQHAADYDVSISEEEQGKIEEAAQAFMDANTEETIQNLSVSQSDVETLLELYTYQTKMYDPMVADVDTNVEDAEAAQSKITYCRFDISDTQNEDGTTTPLTDEEKQEKKDEAQALLDKLLASPDPASADMDALAKEVNEDLNAVDNTFGDDDTLLDDKLKEAAKTLQDGQVYGEVVEGENAYFVVRMDSVLDREATDAEKENIVSERQQDAYNDLLDQWKDDADITVNNREWDKVTLTDNEQYTIKQPETEDTTEDSSTDAGDTTEDSTDTQEDTSSDTQAE
ncbi:MAG TPA: peptidyl-prolyl cis-trans isomerase [Candidatus Blautia stercoripullorum]|uniref:Peptidyl-prolyl cis-trans isomerase n=1 Tax=Candidatus Blautia stercoripullorum TaxID=2838502 RepID=A0A9D2U586_9FIRM|nr:peptidyl-prolyl cis-trans isomerase [Candidatus Blautia stercoripullorum]